MTTSALPQNTGATKICFISDLHLDAERPDILAAFLAFVQQQKSNCASLYILGDLFDAWIGDDERSELIESVSSALRELSESGTQVRLMHGNRDFLMGEQFASNCGAALLKEPTIIHSGKLRLALLHGDSLCTRDTDYIKFRELVRSPQWQAEFLAKSLLERQTIAQQLRQQSQAHNSNKASDIMNVTPMEVMAFFQREQIDILIHGHTHRPAIHTIHLDNAIHGNDVATRIVLGDWDRKGWVLEFCGNDFELRHFSIES